MPTRAEAEAMLKFYPPGSVTVEDLMYSESDDSDVEVFELNRGGQVVSSAKRVVSNPQQAPTSMQKMQPSQNRAPNSAVMRRVRVDDDYEFGSGGGGGYGGGGGAAKMNQKVLNELRDATHATKAKHETDRSERATVENVMDPRTRMILYKLVNTKLLLEVNGCVSTGKEANVYYALSGDNTAAAVKVYKTSILVFKDRDQYVAGEFRFQRYCKSNPRKMVRTWAEKEARNLTRLANAGVLGPKVRILRQHVLVMDFIGEDGWPAPRLKEVQFPSQNALNRCYTDIIAAMRRMFHQCKLVHGDLSEYNMLFFNGRVYIIDVSQSVEHNHPQALNFLRRDIVNVNAFFRSKGLMSLLTVKEMYQVITSLDSERFGLTHEEIMARLAAWEPQRLNRTLNEADAVADEEAAHRPADLEGVSVEESRAADGGKGVAKGLHEHEDGDEDDIKSAASKKAKKSSSSSSAAAVSVSTTGRINTAKQQAAIDEQVFLQIDIPTSIQGYSDVRKPQREVAAFVEEMLADGRTRSAVKDGLASKKTTATKTREINSDGDYSDSDEDADDFDDEEDEEGEEEEGEGRRAKKERVKTLSEMTKEEKRDHKKAVKEANKERRANKVAKKEKNKTRRVKHK